MTEELFRQDSYLRSCDAQITDIKDDGVVLDRTVFYPNGGGQPGDRGSLTLESGERMTVIDTQYRDGVLTHLLEPGAVLPAIGCVVTAEIDWERRYRFMRMHTCMHLLCSVVPLAVTGGSIREDSARLDFDAPEPLDKAEVNEKLQRLVAQDNPVSMRWISDEELDQQPDLVRTLSVQPPRGSGQIRLINIEGVDLQPCGGTHLASAGEVGAVRVRKIEKKGRQNRRITVVFDD